MEDIIRYVFILLGVLVISLTLFSLIFSSQGQTKLWSVTESAMVSEWQKDTLNAGTYRSAVLTDVGYAYEQSGTAEW